MRNLFALIIFSMTTSLNAETLSFPSFRIEIPDGWEHSIENSPGDDSRSTMVLHDPDGVGNLKMRSYDAPAVVSQDRLRNMTNVESSISLTWQTWGHNSGFQYSYSEGNKYFRQWWLTNERTIIFVTYQCDPESRDIETTEIDEIVRSIVTTPDVE